MKVLYGEGLASRTGPESCVRHREVAGEALAGDGIGQPLSRESRYIRDADAVLVAEGNTEGRAMRVPCRSRVVRDPGICRRSLYGNREISRPAGRRNAAPVRVGKARSRIR